MKKLENLAIEKVYLRAEPATHLDACLREAVVFAVTEGVPVSLSHNEREYDIDPQQVLYPIRKQHR